MRRRVLVLLLLTACRENVEELPDHDEDGTIDLYDTCPTRYNPGAEDADNDGVGDACDPHLSSAADTIVSYTFFENELGAWTPETIDNWALGPEGASTTAAADATLARLTYDFEGTAPTIELTFNVLEYGPMTARRDNVILVNASIEGTGVYCMLSNRDEGSATINVLGANSNDDSVGVIPIDPNFVAQLRMTFDATETRCVGNEGTYTIASATPTSTNVHSQIIVERMQVLLTSAVVYRVN